MTKATGFPPALRYLPLDIYTRMRAHVIPPLVSSVIRFPTEDLCATS